MSNIDLKDIGQQLKEARESKSMTVEDIAEKTKLRKDQVLAIENGDASKLPPGPYVKGFVKLYYKAVGLNFVDQTAAPTVDTTIPTRTKRKPMKRSSLSIDFNGIIFFAIFLVIISLAVYLVVGYFAGPKNTIEVPNGPPIIIEDEDLEEDEAKEDEGVAAEEELEEPEELEPEALIELTIENNNYYYNVSNQESLEVTLIIDGQCWVDIKIDGNSSSYKEGMLLNEEVTIEAEEEVYIRAGSATTATIIINGEEVEFSDYTGPRNAFIRLEKSGE